MANEQTRLEELVAYIVRAVVKDSDAVETREVSGPEGPKVMVKVAPEEVGRLIGRQGRTIQSLRDLLAAGVYHFSDEIQGVPTIEIDEDGR
jgi:hypothetical protein